MTEKISAVYKITNTITGDFYIGSSKNIKSRWAAHKRPSVWKQCPNKQLYKDMQKYGVDKFVFEILEEVESEKLKKKEQQFIEILKPTYNDRNAKGLDIERYKESRKSDKCKEYYKEYYKKYQKSNKYKNYQQDYRKSDKCKEYQKEYHNQLCSYNNEALTLNALSKRFRRAGIENPTIEAKKYLIK